ncbi:MAG: mycofactocin biosynthesis peptidyl-dipeptidase MftE [Acidimicrobiales bacterium]
MTTWTEVARSPGALLVVPLGSYEQHGPHLPLDTDTRIACALVQRISGLGFVHVAAPFGYGASGEHADFSGTLSIGTGVLADALVELVRSARGAFGTVVVVCAHGGNADALVAAQERCRRDGDTLGVWWACPKGDAHAGRTETSLMLAIDPSTVREEAIEPGRREPLEVLWPELRRHGVKAVSSNGVLGDPRGASALEGKDMLDAMASDLEAVLRELWLRTAAGGVSRGER